MRPHNTPEEKEIRRKRYDVLRAVGYNPKQAARLRDWTDNKIDKILMGEARPIL